MDLKTHFRTRFKENLIKLQKQGNIYALDSNLTKSLDIFLQDQIKNCKSNRPINILFYYPLPIEYDIRKILNRYKKHKKIQIFLPFMQGISFKIVKYRLPLHKRTFGIYESGDSKLIITKLDFAIVPVIGIDQTFRRIGFGKGMYDRFFSTLKTQPKTIFICRALNLAYCNITQPHDLHANIFITPFAFLEFKGKSNDNLGFYRINPLRTFSRRR